MFTYGAPQLNYELIKKFNPTLTSTASSGGSLTVTRPWFEKDSFQAGRLPPALAQAAMTSPYTQAAGEKEAETQGIDLNGSISQFNAESQTRINEALASGDFSRLQPIEIAWVNKQVAKTTAELEAQAATGDVAADTILTEKAQVAEEMAIAEATQDIQIDKDAQRSRRMKTGGAILLLLGAGYAIYKLTEK